MNGNFSNRAGNIPYAFNPESNASIATGGANHLQASTAQDRLVVGVDFGTTFSGVAAVYSATPDDIDIIKTWPGGNGNLSKKRRNVIRLQKLIPRSRNYLRQSTYRDRLQRTAAERLRLPTRKVRKACTEHKMGLPI
jgi:molecular chaperone DnaK (HSP70)